MSLLLKLHTDMLLGLPGMLFLGLMGLIFIVAIVSGVVLYAPFMRRLESGRYGVTALHACACWMNTTCWAWSRLAGRLPSA